MTCRISEHPPAAGIDMKQPGTQAKNLASLGDFGLYF